MDWRLDIPGHVARLVVQRSYQAGWTIEQFLAEHPDLMQELSTLALAPVSKEQESEA